jgi:hypothetical protein
VTDTWATRQARLMMLMSAVKQRGRCLERQLLVVQQILHQPGAPRTPCRAPPPRRGTALRVQRAKVGVAWVDTLQPMMQWQLCQPHSKQLQAVVMICMHTVQCVDMPCCCCCNKQASLIKTH